MSEPMPVPTPETTAWDACQEAAKVLRDLGSQLSEVEKSLDSDQRMAAWLGLAESWRHLAETMNGGSDSKRCITAPRKDDDERR